MRPMPTIPKLLLCLTLIAPFIHAQQPDVLTPNGSAHTIFYGSFKAADSNGVTFHTDADVDVTVPWDKVKSLEVHESLFALSNKGAKQETPAALTITPVLANKVLTLSAFGIPISNIAEIVPATERTAALKPAWDVSISPSFSLAYGDQVVQTWGAQVIASRTQNPYDSDWHHQQTSLTLDANNTLTEQPGSSTRVHEYDGELAHTVYLSHGWYATFLGDGYHNSSQNVYLQQYYGGGVGRRFSGEKEFFELTVAPVYVGQHFYGAASQGFAGVKLYQGTTFLLGTTKGGPINLAETTSYIPAINAAKSWQIRGTSSLTIPINQRLSFVTAFTDDYLEDAPGRKNYSYTSVGVSFTLLPGH